MNRIGTVLAFSLLIATACKPVIYSTNGETIYKSGKNTSGQELLDKNRSQIRFVKSCMGCHGENGTNVRKCDIRWSSLTNPKKLAVPYTDSLLYRFLDEDIKSDGSPARTGVHWNMGLQDKKDLVTFLKTLK